MTPSVQERRSRSGCLPSLGPRTFCLLAGLAVAGGFGYLINGIYGIQLEIHDNERLGSLAVEAACVVVWLASLIIILISGMIPRAYPFILTVHILSWLILATSHIIHSGAGGDHVFHGGRVSTHHLYETGLLFGALFISACGALLGYLACDDGLYVEQPPSEDSDEGEKVE